MSQRHIRVFVRVYKIGSASGFSFYLEGAWKKIYCKTWIYTCSGYG